MRTPLSRRHLLGASAAFGAAALLPSPLSAQGKTLVAATFPGTWNEAHREFLAPAFTKRTGASVTQSILLGNDQLSRLTAAKGGKPPFDVALFDSPQVLDAAKQGLIAPYPAAQSPNYKDLLPEFQDKWGPRISMQIIGIGYNPQKIKTPLSRSAAREIIRNYAPWVESWITPATVLRIGGADPQRGCVLGMPAGHQMVLAEHAGVPSDGRFDGERVLEEALALRVLGQESPRRRTRQCDAQRGPAQGGHGRCRTSRRDVTSSARRS